MSSLDSRNRGYAFLILMLIVTVLLISLTAALPSIYTAGQREKEEELIFRGNQYAHAIMLFHRQFGRYPASVDDVYKKTNGYRYLRKKFKDPMTQSGTWRFIHGDARGIALDSRTMPIGTGAINQITQTPNANQVSQADAATHDQNSGDSSLTKQMVGAVILGVASTNAKTSIRVWNDRNRYDQWEFLATAQGNIILPGQQQTPTGPGQNPTQTPGQGPGQRPGVPGPGGGQPPDLPPTTDEPISQ